MNFEPLLYSLLLAAVSGLTFVAYKHPTAYVKIFQRVFRIIIFLPIVIIALNLGGLYAGILSLGEKLSEKPESPISDSTYLITTLNENLDVVTLTIVIWTAVFGYLWFLYKLPSLLEESDQDDDTK